MTSSNSSETAYAFSLDAVRGGYLYFRTISLFAGAFGRNGRDLRQAHPVIIKKFKHSMDLLCLPVRWVRREEDVTEWTQEFGWALVPTEIAENHLVGFLGPRECVKSAIGLFWDVLLRRNRAASRRISRELRERVLARNGCRCIECSRTETDQVTLTMDHVIPFTRGGETTEGNLVTLCEACNQAHGNAHHFHLFALAGLHEGWDPSLYDNVVSADSDTLEFAMMLSQNIMVSRCRTEALSQTPVDKRPTT